MAGGSHDRDSMVADPASSQKRERRAYPATSKGAPFQDDLLRMKSMSFWNGGLERIWRSERLGTPDAFIIMSSYTEE